MGEKYQESLELFKRIYFNKDGKLDRTGWDTENMVYRSDMEYAGSDKLSYLELGLDSQQEFRSKIIGKSAFTPKILRVSRVKENTTQKPDIDSEEARYFLTVDENGKFNCDPHWEFSLPSGSVDVTDLSQEEIMGMVERLLNMQNHDVMSFFEMFNYKPRQIIEHLLLDDVVQECLSEKGIEPIKKTYEEHYDDYYDTIFWSIVTETAEGRVEISNHDNAPDISIYDKQHGNVLAIDTIDCEFLIPEGTTQVSQIGMEIHEQHINTELGTMILEKLRERFDHRGTQGKTILTPDGVVVDALKGLTAVDLSRAAEYEEDKRRTPEEAEHSEQE